MKIILYPRGQVCSIVLNTSMSSLLGCTYVETFPPGILIYSLSQLLTRHYYKSAEFVF